MRALNCVQGPEGSEQRQSDDGSINFGSVHQMLHADSPTGAQDTGEKNGHEEVTERVN